MDSFMVTVSLSAFYFFKWQLGGVKTNSTPILCVVIASILFVSLEVFLGKLVKR